MLQVLLEEGAYSDVVREAQQIVELGLKGMLRKVGVEPPKWHDVGPLLKEYESRFSREDACAVERLCEISAWLRKEREFAFYGDIDSIPTERYGMADAVQAVRDVEFVLAVASAVIAGGE
jgi:HEPN domain-containing protein